MGFIFFSCCCFGLFYLGFPGGWVGLELVWFGFGLFALVWFGLVGLVHLLHFGLFALLWLPPTSLHSSDNSLITQQGCGTHHEL